MPSTERENLAAGGGYWLGGVEMSRNGIKLACALLFVLLAMLGCGRERGTAANDPVIVAKAGLSQTVIAGSSVSLDGSQSIGDSGSLTYHWSMASKPFGSAAIINNPTAVNPTFRTDLPGQYSIRLIVSNANSETSEDSITITATSSGDLTPVANAGAAQLAVTGSRVTLDGSASSAANGQFLNYSWTIISTPAGSEATLSSSTIARPSFTADVDGSYTFNLIVNDGSLDSTAATITVTATTPSEISVAPLDVTISMGQNKQFFAIGLFATTGSRDISAAVHWTSTDTEVATVDGKGLATATGPGTTVISAAIAGRSVSTTLTVQPATLVSVRVGRLPILPPISAGDTMQLTATATYSDQSKQDITELASWSAYYARFGTVCVNVSDTPGSKGFISTTGSACYERISATFGGMKHTVGVTVR